LLLSRAIKPTAKLRKMHTATEDAVVDPAAHCHRIRAKLLQILVRFHERRRSCFESDSAIGDQETKNYSKPGL
jgi:hypothetical protein